MRSLVCLLLAGLLLGCSPQRPAFNNVDITGAAYAQDFALTDHTGARRKLSDFRGKLVTIFFGYTQCPDVCPITLQQMVEIKEKLGPRGDDLQVIFVTVDPERDTAQVLAQYVPAFDSSFLGLTGSPEEVAQTAKQFKVFYQKVPGQSPSSYTMDHTAGTYVFDREGKPRLFLRHGQEVAAIVADLERLL